VDQTRTLGTDFAHALAAKDTDRLRALLHPEIDFRGMTPNRMWEAIGPDAVLEVLFGNWLEDTDRVDALEHVDDDAFADRQRVGYRISGTNRGGGFVVEQQAYLTARDGQIGWLRILCSGFRLTDARR
jgi:hypothetical protein